MIHIIANVPLLSREVEKSLEAAARAALDNERPAQVFDLSIVIENDNSMRKLNHQYRGIDETTDVLSFESDTTDPETGIPYLGDIIISLEQAARQAEKSKHPLDAELQLLTVHGTLHLLGFDHGEEEEKKVMWAHQKEILVSLGARLSVWPEV